jgi:DNA invertase Pin-like site-specific DNA recombinase
MNESKVTAAHLRRTAVIYVRQSSLAQVDRNKESTARQYDLAARAHALGWPSGAVRVIDDDLGVSGASTAGRSGFAELAAQVGLGQVGIVLALEVSRLARNNSDWYRLLDLAGMTDTLIADADGVYHPGLFNDRLLLGMKGTMSEAELHILRARLHGGIRTKAARGELRIGLPIGLVWGEADGQILKHPNEAVRGVLTAIFEQFPARGSVRSVWLWLRDQGLQLPLSKNGHLAASAEIVWVDPTYHAVHNILTHPAYAGAYTFGRTGQHRYVGSDGAPRVRRKVLPRNQWEVCITGHHEGFIDWDTYLANQARIGANIRPAAHQPGTGAVREGCALLQGLVTCGTCGRKLSVYYDGERKATPGYYCTGTGQLVDGRGTRHLRVGGVAIDAAVTALFLTALAPAAAQACLQAAQQLEDGHHGQGRTPLSGGRPGEPARRPRTGERVGDRAAAPRRRRDRTRAPRSSTPENPDTTGESGDPCPRRRPAGRVGGGYHHRPRPQTTPAHPARRGQHHRSPRRNRLPCRPDRAVEGRRDQRADRRTQAHPE